MNRWTTWRAKREMTGQRLALLDDLAVVLMSEKPDVEAALRRVADRNAGKPIELAYRQVIASIKSGRFNGLADTIEPFFPPGEYLLLKAFDTGAKTDYERGQGYSTAASILSPLKELRSGFSRLMGSLAFTIGLLLFLWLFMVPEFVAVLGLLVERSQWPMVSTITFESAMWVRRHWIWVSLLFVAALGALIWAFPNWRGAARRSVDRKIPGFVIFREYRSVTALVGLACFVKAGQGLDWALRQLLLLSTRWEQDYIEAIHKRSTKYSAGKMLDVGYFPDTVVDRVSMLEGSASLEESLNRIGLGGIHQLTKQMHQRLETSKLVLSDVSKLIGGFLVVSILQLLIAAQGAISAITR